jgi:hypothetical protein
LDSGVKETILFSLEKKMKLALKVLKKNHFSGLGSEDAIEGLEICGEFTRDGGMESINHLYTLLLTKFLIYPQYSRKWNNGFICI